MLTVLTGGYRRTPVMQIGADFYCDSQCIIVELERRYPSPSYMPTSEAGLMWCISRWTDGAFFDLAVKLVLGAAGDDLPTDFTEDRGRHYLGENWAYRLKTANTQLPHLDSQVRAPLTWLNTQLSGGSGFILSAAPSTINAQIYHAVWFIRRRWAGGPALLSEFPDLVRWENRVRAIGHGTGSMNAPKAHAREQAVWEKRRSAILKGADKEPEATRADLLALGPEPMAPLRPSIVAGSTTVEGIVKHLPELRASLGIMTDEGGMMLGGHGMKAENRLNTLATLAAMWDGSTLDRWRAGDGIASQAGRRFSAHIMIQPKAAEGFLSDPLANGQGLLARFLTCRPTSHIGQRLRLTPDANADREIDRFASRIEALLRHPLALAEGRRNELAPPVLTLDADALAVLTDFARQVEEAQAPGGEFENSRASASKTAEHAARLAAVMTLYTDPDATKVTGETMAAAAILASFYARKAARSQNASVIPPHIADAELMRGWLISSWPEEYIAPPVACQRGPFKLMERVKKTLAILESQGWLVSAPGALVDGKPRKEAWRIIRDQD